MPHVPVHSSPGASVMSESPELKASAGQVIGSTDREGGYPTSHPTDPKDILATMYHLLGFDPHQTTVPDRLGRPMHIIPHGDVVQELLA